MMKTYPRKILIVEDDQDQMFLIQKTLEQWAEGKACEFHLAHAVEEALGKISSSSYDLILTDYRLPDNTGLDLLKEIKRKNLKTPVILMTAVGDEALATRALKAGCFDYVAKSDNYIRRLPSVIEDAFARYLAREADIKRREELVKKNEALASKNKKLAELSVSDDLTGLYNHRFLQEKFAEEFARASRYHYPLSCLMVDLDHFKTVNDIYGHQVGDVVLKEMADFFSSYLRQADTIARYGGEEFCVLLPHGTYEGAQSLAERLRKQIMALSFATAAGQSIKLTVSIGISSYPEDPIDNKDTMLFYADKALYRAKAAGRNRVCLYQSIVKEYAKKIPSVKVEDDQVLELTQRLIDISEMSKRAYIEATKALINALEAKDSYTLGHATRVARLSWEIGQEMGFGMDDVRIFEHAGLLHDIGKICIKNEVLMKPAEFDPAEYENMKEHAVLGYQIVKPIKFLSEEATIILHHHEWYNGKGYPYHLKGKEIPVGSRIVAVADAYDTMRVAGGRYKQTMNCEEAARELIHFAGTQFDPEVVYHFVQTLMRKGDLVLKAEDQKELDSFIKAVA